MEEESSSLSNSDYSLHDSEQSTNLCINDSDNFPTISYLLKTPEIPQKNSITSRRKAMIYRTQQFVESLFKPKDKKNKKLTLNDVNKKKGSL